VIALLILTAAAFPLRQHFEQQAKIRELEGRIDTLTEERSSLEVEVRRLQDPEYLERLARRCLGMVRPGEVALVTVPDEGGVPRNSC
jgi:cell division protein FtsB